MKEIRVKKQIPNRIYSIKTKRKRQRRRGVQISREHANGRESTKAGLFCVDGKIYDNFMLCL